MEAFLSEEATYHLLPFRFMRWRDGRVLLVNDVGEFHFIAAGELAPLIHHQVPRTSPLYLDLLAKHMIADGGLSTAVDLVATKYRTKKSFLAGFTGLHMFVVTLRCDHTCKYCQVSRVSEDKEAFDMSRETAMQSVDLMFRSPSPDLKVEFQGGEPLLNLDIIRLIIEYTKKINRGEDRNLEFVVATNLSKLDRAAIDLFKEHDVLISTSLDGPAHVHDGNRPNRKRDSHEQTVQNILIAREALGHDRVAALMTTTGLSLESPREIVREYVRLGFESIFLRSVSPYGFAITSGQSRSYDAQGFVEFFKEALDEIIEANREGAEIIEVYSQILLTKILTPFATGYVDLQSPAGTGIGGVVYNYDGGVYASDESRMLAEMGVDAFNLGNVLEDTYQEIFGGPTLEALINGSVLETLPGCSDCAFSPYCGADPVRHYATHGDIYGHRPTSDFCSRNMGIIEHLFDLLNGEDPFVCDLLQGWAWGHATELSTRTGTP